MTRHGHANVSITLRVRSDLLARLEAAAARAGRTRSKTFGYLLAFALDKYEREQAEAESQQTEEESQQTEEESESEEESLEAGMLRALRGLGGRER